MAANAVYTLKMPNMSSSFWKCYSKESTEDMEDCPVCEMHAWSAYKRDPYRMPINWVCDYCGYSELSCGIPEGAVLRNGTPSPVLYRIAGIQYVRKAYLVIGNELQLFGYNPWELHDKTRLELIKYAKLTIQRVNLEHLRSVRTGDMPIGVFADHLEDISHPAQKRFRAMA